MTHSTVIGALIVKSNKHLSFKRYKIMYRDAHAQQAYTVIKRWLENGKESKHAIDKRAWVGNDESLTIHGKCSHEELGC